MENLSATEVDILQHLAMSSNSDSDTNDVFQGAAAAPASLSPYSNINAWTKNRESVEDLLSKDDYGRHRDEHHHIPASSHFLEHNNAVKAQQHHWEPGENFTRQYEDRHFLASHEPSQSITAQSFVTHKAGSTAEIGRNSDIRESVSGNKNNRSRRNSCNIESRVITDATSSSGVIVAHGSDTAPGNNSFTRGRRSCKVNNCNKAIQKDGLCHRHGGKRLCQASGCNRKDRGGGFCVTHGGGKRCTLEGCNRAVRKGRFCSQHTSP